MVYASDSGVQNTTGVFTEDDLEICPWCWLYPNSQTNVTATATLNNGTILQKSVVVEADAINPLK